MPFSSSPSNIDEFNFHGTSSPRPASSSTVVGRQIVVLLCNSTVLNTNCVTDSENLALNRTVWQSSTGTWGWPASASLSVDGNKDPSYSHGSCSHTLKDVNPWWVVDIGRQRTVISGVNLTNRGDDTAVGQY
jgi:hypothetical protein